MKGNLQVMFFLSVRIFFFFIFISNQIQPAYVIKQGGDSHHIFI